jgi:hypothetical protein
MHHWGESAFGYYRSDDPWVLRKHAQMLSDAGVDVITTGAHLIERRGIETELVWQSTSYGVEADVRNLEAGIIGVARHRERLRRMVAVRMDRRLAPRMDPSDIVQDVLADADRELTDYLRRRPVPFYPWLRQLAWDRLIDVHRRHVRAGKRSVKPTFAAPPTIRKRPMKKTRRPQSTSSYSR